MPVDESLDPSQKASDLPRSSGAQTYQEMKMKGARMGSVERQTSPEQDLGLGQARL